MRIKRLHIENFRCFKDYEFKMAPEINVIIGRNGAGKTTIINAMHKALSFIFSNDKSLGKDFLSSGNASLKINSYESGDYRFDVETRTIASSANIHAEAVYGGHDITWDMYKRATSGAALYSSKYKEAFETFTNAWKNEGTDLPLLAYYSDSFPHKNLKQVKYATDTISYDIMPRNFGYYQWDVEGACTSLWEQRLCNKLAQTLPLYTPASRIASKIMNLETSLSKDQLCESVEYKKLKKDQNDLSEKIEILQEETKYIEERLSRFVSMLPSLKDEGYDIDYLNAESKDKEYELIIIFKNGKTEAFRDLPAGYRRLYSIVLDMAYRSYILNGKKEPCGVVMIDEVDLHLHPSLEQNVVNALHETFPNVQFVMSTHSPAVISNLKTTEVDGEGVRLNKIMIMQEGQTEADELPHIYGLDYNSALRDFMETPSRNSDIENLANEYLTYISLDLKDDASIMKKRLKEMLGREDHPVILELEEKAKNYEVH